MRSLRLAVLLCLAATAAYAEPAIPVQTQSPGLLCRQAIVAAAAAHGVPTSLMAAVGRVESGRRDPVSGTWHPWPWTVDSDGQGTFYDTKAQAIAAVRALQASGGHSIDVGCMQVNLRHHPHAFASLDQAFDPQANADYAARFLTELKDQTGSWPRATAMYHSATPALGAAYEQKVMALWPEEQRLTGTGALLTVARSWGSPFHGGLFAPPPRRESGARFLPPALPGQAAPPGRGLASYRAAPVMLGWRHRSG